MTASARVLVVAGLLAVGVVTGASRAEAAGVFEASVSVTTEAAWVAEGDAATFTVQVRALDPVAPEPSGNATFSVDGRPVGTPVALDASVASITVPGLAVGPHEVTVAYGGDAAFGPVAAGAGTRVLVLPAGTSRFVPLPPSRVLDTRPDGPQIGHVGPKPGPDSTLLLRVAGVGGVPAEGVTAVALNLTATDAAGPGFVTAYPADRPRPLAANLNPELAGQTIPNLVVVPVSADGSLRIYTLASTHLVGDVQGYFVASGATTAGRFVPVPPARLLDTRPDGPQTGYAGPVPADGATVHLQATGRGGVPAEGVSAVVLNVTATESRRDAGFVTVYPADVSRPLAANLNITRRGQTISNAVWVPVSPTGAIDLYVQQSTDLVVDVTGWITSDRVRSSTEGLFVPVVPSRVMDTRPDGPRRGYDGGKPGAGSTSTFRGQPVPSGQATAVVANIAVTEASGPGFVTAFGAGTPRPLASVLNVERVGQTRPNLVTTPLGADGGVDLYTLAGGHLVVDVAGWFTADLDPPPAATQHLSYRPASSTRMIEAGDVTSVTSDGAGGHVVVLRAGVTAPGIGNGLVLKAGGTAYPSGLAGTVRAVGAGPGGTTSVTTDAAALEDLFESLDVGYDGPADLQVVGTDPAVTQQTTDGVPAAINVSTSLDRSLFEFGVGALDCTGAAGLTLSRSIIRFENTRVHFAKVVGLFVTPYVALYVTTEPIVEWSAELHGAVTCELSNTFRRSHRLVWTLPGEVPVTIDLAPALEIKVQAAGAMTVTDHMYRTIGFDTNPDLSVHLIDGASHTLEAVDLGASVSASVLLGADVSIKVLDIVGIGLTIGPRVTASVDDRSCRDLGLTFEANFDLRIDLWIKQFKRTFLTVSVGPWSLYHRCPVPSNIDPPSFFGLSVSSCQNRDGGGEQIYSCIVRPFASPARRTYLAGQRYIWLEVAKPDPVDSTFYYENFLGPIPVAAPTVPKVLGALPQFRGETRCYRAYVWFGGSGPYLADGGSIVASPTKCLRIDASGYSFVATPTVDWIIGHAGPGASTVPPSGVILRDATGASFALRQGIRHRIPDGGTFQCLTTNGYRLIDVQTFAAYREGSTQVCP